MFDGLKKRTKGLFTDSTRADIIPWIFDNATKDTQSMSQPETFFNHSLYLNKAIGKRAEVLSSIKFKAVNSEGEINDNFQEVLEQPNNLLSGRDMIELLQKHYDVYGEFFVWKEDSVGNNIRSLHILNPKNMEKEIEMGEVQRFMLKNEKKKDKKKFDPEEIIWQHRPDPNDYKKPQSLVTTASKDALRAEIELREYQAKVARSGGRFDSVISIDKEINEKDLKEMKERYKERQNKAKRSREGTTPFFAGSKVNVEDLDRSPKELDYIESKRSVMEEISTVTGVPRSILSTFENIKYSNAEEARKTFLRETIKPLADKFTETLTRNLPENVKVVYEDFIPEDHDEKMERLQTGAETGALSPNEIRQALNREELDIPEADKPFVNMNQVPIDETSPQL